MPEPMIGFQVAAAPEPQQAQVQPEIQHGRRTPNISPSLSEFIVDDLKLFVTPVTVVVDEFLKQLKR